MSRYINLQYEKRGGVAHITVNRPDVLNALNRATLLELQYAFADASADAQVRGVIVSGAGNAFVAGADIHELAEVGAIAAVDFTRLGQRIFNEIERLGKPVIAAVNGYAFGGGCELAMACTLRIASAQAMFGLPEVKLGVIPGFGGTQRLPRLVGAGRAMQLILTAQPIDAKEAHRIGLVNEVVDADQLASRANDILEQVMANGPLAVQRAAEAIRCGADMALDDGLALESLLFSNCAGSSDKQEGTQAFLDKRRPRFTGV